jgi:hypothetical protein
MILANVIGCRQCKFDLEARSESRKFFDLNFNALFNSNKMPILKKYSNKVYIKLNCASNNVKIT